MMSGRAAELTATGCLVALCSAACVGALRLGLGDVHAPGPGFMPFAIAALLGLMALGRLVRVAATGSGDGPGPFAQSRWGVTLIVLGTLAGFGVVIERAGFTVSTFLLLLVLLGVVARKRWWVALVVALAVAVAARVILTALGLQLPAGPLGL